MTKKSKDHFEINGLLGICGNLPVFIGFAKASILYRFSFADVLNEDTGEGYQRPINEAHSKSFRNYISRPNTSTIPLTFNLRPNVRNSWDIVEKQENNATLILFGEKPSLARVDCQHRISQLYDSDIVFAFMTYIGLDIKQEMALFNIINSKAKGLSSSLTDYHQSRLIDDLEKEAPHLLIARRLNEDPLSPWYHMIRYGGENTSGLMRRASFRMVQSSIRKAINKLPTGSFTSFDMIYSAILSYWNAIKVIFPVEWEDHRHHLLTKGVGLYSLMELFSEIVISNNTNEFSESWFENKLQPLKGGIDWSSSGVFSNAGGKKGAHEIFLILKDRIEYAHTIS